MLQCVQHSIHVKSGASTLSVVERLMIRSGRGDRALQQPPVNDFIDHALPEVRHVFLSEVDFRVSRDVLRIFASEHPAIGSVALLRKTFQVLTSPSADIELLFLLVLKFILEVSQKTRQAMIVVASHRVVVVDGLLAEVNDS